MTPLRSKYTHTLDFELEVTGFTYSMLQAWYVQVRLSKIRKEPSLGNLATPTFKVLYLLGCRHCGELAIQCGDDHDCLLNPSSG